MALHVRSISKAPALGMPDTMLNGQAIDHLPTDTTTVLCTGAARGCAEVDAALCTTKKRVACSFVHGGVNGNGKGIPTASVPQATGKGFKEWHRQDSAPTSYIPCPTSPVALPTCHPSAAGIDP